MKCEVGRIVALAVLFLGAFSAVAAPIGAPQAKRAVTKWVAERPAAHMEANFTSGVRDVETVTSDGGDDLFHIVTLENGGFVITSTDDGIQPIIAFSDSGTLEKTDENPMWVMLNRDLPGRLAAVQQTVTLPALAAAAPTNGATTVMTPAASVQSANEEWADLLAEDEASAPEGALLALNASGGKSSLSDVRVSPLVQTKWSQSKDSAGSANCYNYYTPNNYVCGCVATAGAQLMKYWAYPTASVSAETFSCWVGSTVTSKTMMGGTYAWSSMVNSPGSSTTAAARQAIGKLCYDVGVATRMQWTSGGSGACPAVLAQSLVNVFGYANAKCHMYNAFDDALYRRSIYANLDAGCPVLLGIYGTRISNTSTTVGHEIVADGYGVYNSTVYTHLNLGWAGKADAWYALPTIYASENDCSFTTIGSVVYNVFTTEAGELITGRITDSSGAALSGVTVTAKNGSTTKSATTNVKGIYALKVTGGKTWSITASKSGYQNGTSSVTVSTSTSSTLAALYAGSYSYYMNGTVGNSWGNDFTLAADAGKPNLAIDKCVLASESTTYDDVSGKTAFAEGEDILLYTGWKNSGAATAEAPFVVRHELLNSSGTVLGTWDYTQSDDQASGHAIYWAGAQWSPLQGLSAGTYRYRVTLDPDGAVAESDESDNATTVTFTVAASEQALTTVTVSGLSTLEPGASSTYTCKAYLADGTVVTVDPVWSIDSGSSYATLDGTGVLKAGVHTVARSVVIRATCTYNGVVKSATKTVSIKAGITLPVALDNTTLTFSTDGDALWYGQSTTSYDGVDAAKSGAIGNSQSSYMETTVTGPGTLSYWYKVSSEAKYDKFTCAMNGTVVLSASGTDKDWGQHSIELTDANPCTIRWTYAKDVSLSKGDDCVYIDKMVWTPTATPVSLTIGGASSVAAGSGLQLSCTAKMSDGTSKSVSPTWSVTTGGAYGEISSGGYLSTYASTVARTIVVKAEYEEGDVVKTATKTISVTAVIPLPDAPVITRSGIGSSSAAILAWDAAANATTYRVYRSTTSARPSTPLKSGLTARTCSDTTAEPGVSYTYWVSAVNGTGETFSEPEEAYRVVTLTAEPTGMTFDYGGAVQSATVKSNAGWTYSTESAWLTIGASGETLTVSVEENEAEEARSAVITVTAAATATYPKSIEIVVSQGGKPKGVDGTPDLAFMAGESGDGRYELYVADSSAGSAGRLFEKETPIYLRWGWGNVGTAAFEGDVVSALQISTADMDLWSYDEMSETVSFDCEAGKNTTVNRDGWSSLEPGVYLASVLIDPEKEFVELEKENNYAEFRFAVRDSVTLSEALDCSALSFETATDAWYGTAGIGSDGEDCAMTKLLGDSTTNRLTTTLPSAGTVSFAYRVSTEAEYDVFRFFVDGEEKLRDSGVGDWHTVSFEIEGDGEHTFEWRYAKDEAGAEGDDCVYLDRVVWTPVRVGVAPSDFTASTDKSPYVMLTWTKVDEATTYVIERTPHGSDDWTQIYSGASSKVYDSDTLSGLDFDYRVKSVYPDGESDWSEIATGHRTASITSPSTRWISAASGSDGFTISPNGRWSAVSKDSWLTIDTASGTNASKFVYRFDANLTDKERSTTITLTIGEPDNGTSSEGYYTTRTITVYQRAAVVTGGTLPLAEAANTTLEFKTSEEHPWIGQRRISHDGVASMRSGEVGQYATSRVETVVATGGTLTFWWGSSSGSADKLTFYVNGVKQGTISGYSNTLAGKTNCCNWAAVTNVIPSSGAVIAWEYVRSNLSGFGEDAAFVDQISWEPTAREVSPEDAWFQKYYPELFDRLGVTWENRKSLLAMQSPGSKDANGDSVGKRHADGSVLTVLDDYVAGTDPLDSDSLFTAKITLVDGVPSITWEPALSDADTLLRNYLIYGKKNLTDTVWSPVAEGHEGEFNFFYVTVEMK